MLVGQEIGFADVMMITAFVMFISMTAMFILWAVVVILSKAVAWKESKNKVQDSQVTSNLPSSDFSDVSMEEIAVIVAATSARIKLHPNQYRITSITSDSDVTSEEVAVIIASICEQTGLRVSQFRIT